MRKIKVKINGNSYNLLYAYTEDQKEKGLQEIVNLDPDEGMFFDYREDPQEELSFWMKDCGLYLDIIFVGEDDEVLSVQHGEPFSEEYLTEDNVYYVIELNQNSGVNKGDEVEIEEDFNNEEFPKNEMLVLNSDGSIQFKLQGGERIFSRVSSKNIIRKAKKALESQDDNDYKALGKYIFKELTAQDNRKEEYINTPEK